MCYARVQPRSVADPASIQQPALQSHPGDVRTRSQTAQDPSAGTKDQDHHPTQDIYTQHQEFSEDLHNQVDKSINVK